MILWESEHRARKHHVCTCCDRTINPGETYLRTRLVHPDADAPYTHKTCAHCRAFIKLYVDDFCPDPHEGWTEDDIDQWKPDAPEAVEHKRRWWVGWRHGRDLYPVPGAGAVAS